MTMFSILLPTRNRLEYLKYAVETVMRQDFDDWEVIISDNCSEEDIEGFTRSLRDPRIRLCRVDEPIPVTDNWNNAIDRSSGDYVIMLGDDDGLMPGYLSTARDLIEEHSRPELIHTNGFLLAYPGAVPGSPNGYTATWTYEIFNADQPYFLDRTTAVKLVGETLDFVVGFGWNMQFSLVSRRLIDELKKYGPVYQSPYPDYYCTNAMFLKAREILVCPAPMVTIGITPKSFGAYYFSGREREGVEFLKNAECGDRGSIDSVVLPGEQHNTSWLISVETVKRNFEQEASSLEVSYGRYRFLQILHTYKLHYIERKTSESRLGELRSMLTTYERMYSFGLGILFRILRVVGKNARRSVLKRITNMVGQYPQGTLHMLRREDAHQNILELFDSESA